MTRRRVRPRAAGATSAMYRIEANSVRILLVSSFYPPDTVGGYEWAAYEVARRLAARGHAIEVLAGEPSGGCPATSGVQRRLRRVGVGDAEPGSPAVAGGNRGYAALKAYCYNYNTLCRVARAFTPEIIYFWSGANLTPAVVAAAEYLRLPLAFHLEDTWLLSARAQGRGPGWSGRLSHGVKLLFAGLPRFALEECLGIYVSSSLQREYHEAGMILGREAVVHNGVRPAPTPRTWPAREPEIKRVGFAGRIRENKGLEPLLAAVELLRRDCRRDLRLEVFGDATGTYAAALQQRYARLRESGQLCWHGRLARDRLLARYAELDLLVVPSTWREPFGLVAVEAMAAGVPVLAACRGALPEIVDRDCGWLVEPGPRALAAAIDGALGEYRLLARKGRAGYDRVRAHFSWTDKVARVERLLLEACKRGQHRCTS